LFTDERTAWQLRRNGMDTNTTGRIHFNTDTLPERDRFPAFCEGMFRHIVGADIVRLGPQPFSGSLNIRRAGAIVIADISFTAAEMTRQAKHIADGNDAIVVQFWRHGLAGFAQGTHAARIGPRQGLTIDNAKSARIRAASTSQFCALTIPRDRILTAATNADRSIGGMLRPNAAFHLLLGYLNGTSADDLAEPSAAKLFGGHVVDLVAHALDAEPAAHAATAGMRAATRAAVLRAIARGSDDPALSAVTVARALGITPRYVHLLLEETGQSFTHHLLARRLARAAALLRDPWSQHRKIADIAGEVGFTDLSYFSRAFRRQFGATPRDVRAAAAGQALRREPGHGPNL
jgi:AraC-like DNA-binding protein